MSSLKIALLPGEGPKRLPPVLLQMPESLLHEPVPCQALSMKVRVISLASQAARWSAARRQFQTVGLMPLREEAVAGDALPLWLREHLYSEALNRQQYHRALRPGEIGCYASHMAVWRQLLASNDRCVAVFEDDIEVAPELLRVLAAVGRITSNWDLIKLIGRPSEKLLSRRPLLRGHDLVRYRRVPSLTGAYVLHRRGAEKLLACRQPFGRPVDVDLRYWWECGLDIFGVQPYPAFHGPSSRYSSIGQRNEPRSLSARWYKLCLQVRYSLLNWIATHGRSRTLTRPDTGPAVPAHLPHVEYVEHDHA